MKTSPLLLVKPDELCMLVKEQTKRWITTMDPHVVQLRKEALERLPWEREGNKPYTVEDFDRHEPLLEQYHLPKHVSLAGRVGQWIYHNMIWRREHGMGLTDAIQRKENRLFFEGQEGMKQFLKEAGESGLPIGMDKKDVGSYGFHLNVNGNKVGYPENREEPEYYRSFPFHFANREAEKHREKHGDVRAYVVLDPKHSRHIGPIFVGLVKALHEKGILFEAKAATPNWVRARRDHMEFKINPYQCQEALDILERHLDGHPYTSDEPMLAWNSGVKGLWFAPSPDEEEQKIGSQIWSPDHGEQENGTKIWGEPIKPDHHQLAALVMSADAMDELAKHLIFWKKINGGREEFEKEAQRVRQILEGKTET